MIEVLVAAALLIVGAFATLAVLDRGAQATGASLQRDRGNALAQEVVEQATGMRYTRDFNDLVGDTVAARLQRALPSDATSAITSTNAPADRAVQGSSWTVKRANTTYTVTYRACTRSDRIQGTVIQGFYDCDRPVAVPPTQPVVPVTTGSCPISLGLLSANKVTTNAAVAAAANDVTVKLQLLNLGATTTLSLQLCLKNVLSAVGLGGLSTPLCNLLGTSNLSTLLTPVNGILGILGSSTGLQLCPATDVDSELPDVTAGIAATTQVETTVSWKDSASGKTRTVQQTAAVRRGASVVTP